MNTYPKYKDSGEQWLGQIPEDWEIGRLANYFTERREKVSDKEFAPLSVTKNGVLPQLENVAKSNDSENRKGVRKGDFVINSRSDRKGSSGVSDRDGSVSLINIVLTPRKSINTAYCNYLLKSQNFIEEFYRYGRGIVADLWTTRYSEMKLMKLAIPPLDEQEAMVAYLDEQTGKIDAAIEREQKMIDLLNERKQIIIQHAVTKGLNPNAPMKDSGIDWIGEIPEGWKRTSLKRVCAIKTGKTPSTTRPAYFEDGTVNWYTPGDLNEFILVDSERKVTNLAAKEQACQVYPECSVYLVGIGGTIGKVAYSEVSASCNQQINVIIPDKESLDYKFLAYYLRTAKTEIYRGANLSTLPIINQDRTGALPIICPPIEEQKAIVVFIAKAADPIDKAIAAKNRVITLLQERKQIIINEVVTGKIKVS